MHQTVVVARVSAMPIATMQHHQYVIVSVAVEITE